MLGLHGPVLFSSFFRRLPAGMVRDGVSQLFKETSPRTFLRTLRLKSCAGWRDAGAIQVVKGENTAEVGRFPGIRNPAKDDVLCWSAGNLPEPPAYQRRPTRGKTMEPILEVRDVRKSYGDFVAVGGVSMSVPPGSIFGLLGPNGAGKTSTIRMIMNITAPDTGAIRVFGHPRTGDDLRRIGYLPEERGLYRKMTVMDQLLFLGEIRGLKRAQLVPEVERWLERVELTSWAKKKIEELSKGMQQKVQLIGTVLHKPDLLILDEPFSGLDPINQELFRELL